MVLRAAGRVLPWLALAIPAGSSAAPPNAEAVPELVVPVQALRIADDDGARRAAIEPAQVARWVEYANGVYKAAGLRLVFDPEHGAFDDLRSTLINSVMPDENATPESFRDSAQQIRETSAKYPGRMVVLFRHGAGPNPTGNGFSDRSSPCVVMPGFECTTACSRQNIALFAHETGHYFGLRHTFRYRHKTVAEAEQHLRDLGGDPAVFDLDGFADTAPDPGIDEVGCSEVLTVRLNGIDLPLPRGNVMAYLDSPTLSISPQQAARVRWVARWRKDRGMAPSNSAPAGAGTTVLECEDLPWTARGLDAKEQPMTDFGWYVWSGERQLLCMADREGAQITIRFQVQTGGRYAVDLYGTLAPDFGIIKVRLDDGLPSAPINLYAPDVLVSDRIPLGDKMLAKGEHRLTVTVSGQCKESAGWRFGLDCVKLRAQKAK
ncbi:MAG: hypothetical protein JSR77_13165 [Planctomycetes bacterium]|nr:hypothetical protein [Planctomycetota bacterium]